MPKLFVPRNTTSRRQRVSVQDLAFSDGRGLVGMTYASAALLCSYHLDGATAGVWLPLGTGTLGTWTTGTVGAPTAPTPTTATTGGTVAANTYRGVVTYKNVVGETVASAQFSATTTGATSTITVPSPAASNGATGWTLYMGTVGGGPYFLQGGVNAIGSSLTLIATPAASGTNPPGSNTAAWYGMAPVDATRLPGIYEISTPNAMWTGGDPILALNGTALFCQPSEFQLTGPDFSAAIGTANALHVYSESLVDAVTVAGSTASAVILSGLPAGRNYVGQRLIHLASSESRAIVAQAYGSGNYTLTPVGAFGADPTTGDIHKIGP